MNKKPIDFIAVQQYLQKKLSNIQQHYDARHFDQVTRLIVDHLYHLRHTYQLPAQVERYFAKAQEDAGKLNAQGAAKRLYNAIIYLCSRHGIFIMREE